MKPAHNTLYARLFLKRGPRLIHPRTSRINNFKCAQIIRQAFTTSGRPILKASVYFNYRPLLRRERRVKRQDTDRRVKNFIHVFFFCLVYFVLVPNKKLLLLLLL